MSFLTRVYHTDGDYAPREPRLNAASPLSKGLYALWPLWPATHAARDISGNGRHASSVNAATFDPVVSSFGNVIISDFKGAGGGSGHFFRCPNFNWPANGGAITINFWNFGTDTTAPAMRSLGAISGDENLGSHAPFSDERLYWDYGDTTNGRISIDYLPFINTTWHMVTLVATGATGTFQAIYVDGVEIASNSNSDAPSVALSGFDIGFKFNENTARVTHQGRMLGFGVWDRVLGPAEIRYLYAPQTRWDLYAPPHRFGLTMPVPAISAGIVFKLLQWRQPLIRR